MKKLSLIALLCLTASSHASAQLYKNVSPSGKVMYADRPDDEAARVMVIHASVAQEKPAALARPASGTSAPAAGTSATLAGAAVGPKLLRMDVMMHLDRVAAASAGRVAFASLVQKAGLSTSPR